MKTTCFYLIKYSQIFGTLLVNSKGITFEPDLESDHNSDFKSNLPTGTSLSEYQCHIDFKDVHGFNPLPLINEKAILSENTFVAKEYKFDIFIQCVLTAVNGITLVSGKSEEGAKLDNLSIVERSPVPIANIYFKLAHTDKEG